DTAPDVFWRSDSPNAGTARTSNAVALARSTAILKLPVGATITYARLYWAAQSPTNAADTTVALNGPAGGTANVTADASYVTPKGSNGVFWYESTADLTSFVFAQGIGAYRLSGVDSVALQNLDSPDPFAGWSLVVFYQLATDPPRNLALFDGLDLVLNNT